MSLAPLIAGLAGGALIGASLSLLWAFNGRLGGLSTMLADVVPGVGSLPLWRIVFLASLLAGAGIGAFSLAALGWNLPRLGGLAAAHDGASRWQILFFGAVIVGIGVRLANGCTSGHGFCGLGRASPRSLVAVLTFMAFAIGTASIIGVFA